MELSCLVVRGRASGTDSSKYPVVVCDAAGKGFRATHDVLVYPPFHAARIKTAARMPDGRYVVRLKGVARSRLAPGTLIIAGGQPVYRSRIGYAISSSAFPPGSYRLAGGLFREHALPGVVRLAPVPSGYRLSASSELPLVAGARYRLRSAGGEGESGAALEGELLLCIPVEVAKNVRPRTGAALAQLRRRLSGGGLPHVELEAAILRLAGWAFVAGDGAVKPALAAAALPRPWAQPFDAAAAVDLPGPAGTRLLVCGPLHDELSAAVERAIGRSPDLRPIANDLGYPLEVVEAVAGGLARSGRVVRDSGRYRRAGTGAGLSPIEKGMLETLRSRTAETGFARAGQGLDRDILESLERRKVVVRVGDRYCAADSYEALARRLLAGRNPGEAIAVSEARGLLGLPREQAVLFLESLDRQGVLRREAAVHRVVRGLGEARR